MRQLLKTMRIACSRFRAKLLLAFLLCTLLPIGIIGCISYEVSYSIARDKIMDSAILAADQVQVQMNARIRQAEAVADTLQYNLYALQSSHGQSAADELLALGELRNNLSLYKSTFDFYHINVFFQDGEPGSREGLYFGALSDMTRWQLAPEELYGLGASSRWLYRPGIQMPFILNREGVARDFILCCRALHNQGTGKLDYAYFIMIDAKELSSLLSDTFASTKIRCYLTTEDGVRVASSVPGSDSKATDGEVHRDTRILDNGWYQIMEIPEEYITGGTAVLLRNILLTLVFAVPLTIVVILMISKGLVKRLDILSGAMKDFQLREEEKLDLKILRPKNPDYYDEIDRLGIAFEEMQEKIRSNMQSILDLSLAEERLKYRLLQSQINPHFLYNILGSIKTCQTIGKLDIANQMITDLTRFYRLTLRKSEELIMIRDEVEIALLYLDMEKLCHSQVLDWTVDMEDGIENFMICKFTLQPFLENCILHGISVHTPDIHIHIEILYGDDTVIIKISDDGAGMPKARLEEIRKQLRDKTVNYEKHFGICNVNARISSELYGCGHIEIDSEPGEGTCITIEFAQMEGETV